MMSLREIAFSVLFQDDGYSYTIGCLSTCDVFIAPRSPCWGRMRQPGWSRRRLVDYYCFRRLAC